MRKQQDLLFDALPPTHVELGSNALYAQLKATLAAVVIVVLAFSLFAPDLGSTTD